MMPTMNGAENKLTRIGVFYDGNYFAHVSNYYLYEHDRKARISLQGLHRFIMEAVATAENSLSSHCRIVDAHYFRGRLTADEAQSRAKLYGERLFDDVLMREGVISHYLPLVGDGEKGIDVWLALEAFELAIYKRFDVIVLVAGDGDYLPLIKKLNTIGTRVMVIGWEFSFTHTNGTLKTTRVSQSLLDEATYPVKMSSVIDEKLPESDNFIKRIGDEPLKRLIENLFVRNTFSMFSPMPIPIQTSSFKEGKIDTLKKGFGFVKQSDGSTLFFHYTDVENVDFYELREADIVRYELGTNEKGICAKKIFKL